MRGLLRKLRRVPLASTVIKIPPRQQEESPAVTDCRALVQLWDSIVITSNFKTDELYFCPYRRINHAWAGIVHYSYLAVV